MHQPSALFSPNAKIHPKKTSNTLILKNISYFLKKKVVLKFQEIETPKIFLIFS